MSIHPTAVIDPAATLGDGVEVGAYAVIDAGVTVGDGCRIESQACLRGPLELGPECIVSAFSVLGGEPQVAGTRGPFGSTRIGARCVFREFTSVNCATHPDRQTVIGDDCYVMEQSHIGHDCQLADNVVLANVVKVGGHAQVGRRTFMGAFTGIHQFSRIGEVVMIGGRSSIQRDVPPFMMVNGDRPKTLDGLNIIGLRRAGIDSEARTALKAAYRVLFRGEGMIPERLAKVDATTPEVERLLEFINESKRGVIGFRVERDA